MPVYLSVLAGLTRGTRLAVGLAEATECKTGLARTMVCVTVRHAPPLFLLLSLGVCGTTRVAFQCCKLSFPIYGSVLPVSVSLWRQVLLLASASSAIRKHVVCGRFRGTSSRCDPVPGSLSQSPARTLTRSSSMHFAALHGANMLHVLGFA